MVPDEEAVQRYGRSCSVHPNAIKVGYMTLSVRHVGISKVRKKERRGTRTRSEASECIGSCRLCKDQLVFGRRHADCRVVGRYRFDT